MTLPTIDFRSIREHEGSVQRGFEELVVELIPWLDEDARGRKVSRHGSPDSGIEAYIELEDGAIWGWQAKYFFRIDNAELQQMRESFETALASCPSLTRYTFVLPMNPPAGQHGESAKRKLERTFETWTSLAASEGRTIEFRFAGESQLIDALLREEHVGHVFYWFDKRILFSQEWLQRRYEQARNKAGPRYTEEVNVDVPIRFAFDGLGLTDRFEEELAKLVEDFARASLRWPSSVEEPELETDTQSDVESLAAAAADYLATWKGAETLGGAAPNWEPFMAKLSDLRQLLDRVLEKLYDNENDDNDRDEPSQGSKASGTPDVIAELRRKAHQIYMAVYQMEEFINSRTARLASRPALFLTGDWGTGKTHLLCDVAARRLAEGRPTVLLLGEELDDGNPRNAIFGQLDLAGMTMPEFLATLDMAGRVAGCRALLLLDAVNDVPSRQKIRSFLGGLAAEVREYSHLAVAVSCRSSYVSEVLPRNAGGSSPEDFGFSESKHVGFAGLEFEAASIFFSHWRIEIPDFPLLLPEYSNPLFLKLLCKTLSLRGEKTLPPGSTGVSDLFSGYISAVNGLLADRTRCDFREDKNLVEKAVHRIAQAMIRENVDFVPIGEFEELCEELLPNRQWSSSLARGLIDESVIVTDLGKEGEVVRLSYQRLGDHLQAAWLLDNLDDNDLESRVVDLVNKPWFFRQSSGLLEALAVQLPESRSRELFELVDNPQTLGIQGAVLSSLPWRRPQDCAGDALSSYLKSISGSAGDFHDQVLESKLQLAFHQDHPFNASTLDEQLRHMKLPDRDAYWTIHINSCEARSSAIYRIITWSLSPQHETASNQVVWLASLTLTWCLAASNRGLRDQATKALVSLLRQRIPVLILLLHHFREVDDPYVSERLFAVAYGCALGCSDVRELSGLAQRVYSQVFSSGAPHPHVMLRDYARGVIECAIHRGASLPNLDPKLFRPPYNSAWPVRIPSQETLEARAPRETHRPLWFSLGEMGDFNRYEVAPAVRQFVAPNQRRRLRERRESVRTRANTAQGRSTGIPKIDEMLAKLGGPTSVRTDPVPSRPVMWHSDEASRWILRRVRELGWTSKRFGEYDDRVATYDRYAPVGRTERIGKKYQWIALHELAGKIADHCRYRPMYDDDSDHFDGPWQISLRDIDPSLLMEPSGQGDDPARHTWWRPPTGEIGPFDDDDKRTQWLQGDRNPFGVADLESLLSVWDSDDCKWLTLFGMYSWAESPSTQTAASLSDRGDQWLQIRSYLVPSASYIEFLTWAREQDWNGRWMPEGPTLLGVYHGEWPWHPAVAGTLASPIVVEARDDQNGTAPAPVVPTWAEYIWERDGAFERTVARAFPSSWLMAQAGLRWHPPVTSFTDPNQDILACDPSSSELGPSALLVRERGMREFLDRHDLSLVWAALGGRNVRAENPREHSILSISGVGGLEDADSSVEVSLRTKLH